MKCNYNQSNDDKYKCVSNEGPDEDEFYDARGNQSSHSQVGTTPDQVHTTDLSQLLRRTAAVIAPNISMTEIRKKIKILTDFSLP